MVIDHASAPQYKSAYQIMPIFTHSKDTIATSNLRWSRDTGHTN